MLPLNAGKVVIQAALFVPISAGSGTNAVAASVSINNAYAAAPAVALLTVSEYAGVDASIAGRVASAELITSASMMRGTISAGFTDPCGNAPA